VLPTVFFLMMFVYGPLDQEAYLLFGILSLLSAVACLGWAWFLRHRSRKLAWACMAVGSLYLVLLVVVPLLITVLFPHPTRSSRRAEQQHAADGSQPSRSVAIRTSGRPAPTTDAERSVI